jgi:hypothetical protein
VRKDLLLFFLSLAVISVVLTWFWYNGLQVRYAMLFGPAAKFMFRQLGIHKSGLKLVIEHFTNLVPFIALCIALPRVHWRKRLVRSAIGLGILIVVHFIMIVAASAIYSAYAMSATAYKYIFPILTINDALPLILWFLLFSEEVIGLFRRGKTPPAA